MVVVVSLVMVFERPGRAVRGPAGSGRRRRRSEGADPPLLPWLRGSFVTPLLPRKKRGERERRGESVLTPGFLPRSSASAAFSSPPSPAHHCADWPWGFVSSNSSVTVPESHGIPFNRPLG